MSKNLLEPILDPGVRHVAYFNGRLMTAEDLRTEQASTHWHDEQLGQAIGEGVVRGLYVRPVSLLASPLASPPVSSPLNGLNVSVTVSAGLAFNRKGQALSLSSDTEVVMVRSDEPPPPTTGLFGNCDRPRTTAHLTGDGVYVLVLAPASGFEGRALMSGLSERSTAGACGSRYAVEGVQFRLVRLPLPATALPNARLRNLAAYLCFGVTTDTPDVAAFYRDPFGPPIARRGLLDSLRESNTLTDCDVPLALLHLTAADGVRFIDPWAVRRRPTRLPADERWSFLVGDRRLSEAEAVFHQFQDQVRDMRLREPSLGGITAASRFAFLPPAGLLPVAGPGSPVGFVPLTFFGGRASRDVATLDAPRLRALLQEALYHEPIDLGGPERVQLYSLWENLKAIEAGQVQQRTLVFAKHTLTYRGVARFGYAHWARSRFAPTVI